LFKKAVLSLEFILSITIMLSILFFLFSSFSNAKEKIFLSFNLISKNSLNELCIASIDFFSTNILGEAFLELNDCNIANSLFKAEITGNKVSVKNHFHYLVSK